MTRALLILLMTVLSGCQWAGEQTKHALNKGGELAGSAATEVVEGVTSGVERTWKVDVRLSDALRAKGLVLGKTIVESDSSGRNNRLVLFLSTENAFRDTLTAIAMDEDGLEMGRVAVPLTLAAGSGDHYTIQFQSFTDLERKGRVELR